MRPHRRRRRALLRTSLPVAVGILALGADLSRASEIDASSCAGDPGLVAELVEPPGLGRSCGAQSACWERGLERAREVRDRHPGDYDAHRAYVLVARAAARFLGDRVAAETLAEYEELARSHPGNPAYRHLVAQLSIEGEAYREAIEELVRDFPDYPWGHLSRAYLGRPDAPEDLRSEAVRSLERFVELCPGRVVEVGRALEIQGDAVRAEARLGPLRVAALGRRDVEALAGLWQLTYHFAGEAGRASARARIAQELARLEADGIPGDRATLERLLEVHRLLDDPAGRERIENRLLEGHPCSEPARDLRAARYAARYAFDGGLPGADREPVAAEALRVIDRALERCPDDVWALARRITALRIDPSDRLDELVAAVDRLWAAGGERRVGGPWPDLWKAELWLDLGVRLDRVEALLETDRSAAEAEGSGGDPESSARTRRRLRLAARAAAERAEIERARSLLDRLDSRAATGTGWREELEQDRVRAVLDLAEDRADRALERLRPWLAERPALPALERDARRAWTQARGSEEGFATWRTSAARLATESGPWRTVDRPMPETALVDLAGSEWTWPDPSGRVVFLRTMAAWCVPCRRELDLLDRLARDFAGREDVAFAHLSVDRSAGDVVDFLTRTELAFDVLLGGHELLGAAIEAIPSSWIVSRDGRIVRLQTGPAEEDPEGWLEAARAALREVAGPPPGPAPDAPMGTASAE